MQPWARRGLRTAMVTGGLLMLGTGIASANENVNPDLPPSPLDSPQPLSPAAAPPGTEEVDSLQNTYTTMSDNASGDTNAADVVTQLTDVQQAPTPGLPGAAAPHDEWATLSGDLFDPPSTPLSANGTVFRVPGDILGKAVGNDPATAPATEAAQEFGPSDDADLLLGANQVPLLSDLFTVPRLPGLPVLNGHRPPIMPAGAGRPAVQDMPNTPFSPVSGELPVSGSLPVLTGPSLPKSPTVTATPPHIEPLRDLPPVPTLPAMPALPDLRRTPSTQDRPAMPVVPTVPATQDVPAGAAQQLMAQLRGLISELENSGGGHLHPLNVTALQAPDLQPPSL